MQLNHFSKILHLGHRAIRDIFEDTEVEITEKVDGSQFAFGKIDGEVKCRSKNRMLDMDAPDNLFDAAVEQVHRIADLLPNNYVFWGEYLKKPKHNCIEYSRYPNNHIVLFGMDADYADFWYSMSLMKEYAHRFEFETVPVLFQGMLPNGVEYEFAEQLLSTDSFLGGSKIEGFVVKNWKKAVEMFNLVHYPMAGKYVSEKFKEKMGQREKTLKQSGFNAIKDQYQTEVRWEKAIQHMREDGTLLGEPKDIGPLIKEIQRDIVEECKEEIMHELWSCFSKELLKHATIGFPEWYKRKLMEGEING